MKNNFQAFGQKLQAIVLAILVTVQSFVAPVASLVTVSAPAVTVVTSTPGLAAGGAALLLLTPSCTIYEEASDDVAYNVTTANIDSIILAIQNGNGDIQQQLDLLYAEMLLLRGDVSRLEGKVDNIAFVVANNQLLLDQYQIYFQQLIAQGNAFDGKLDLVIQTLNAIQQQLIAQGLVLNSNAEELAIIRAELAQNHLLLVSANLKLDNLQQWLLQNGNLIQDLIILLGGVPSTLQIILAQSQQNGQDINSGNAATGASLAVIIANQGNLQANMTSGFANLQGQVQANGLTAAQALAIGQQLLLALADLGQDVDQILVNQVQMMANQASFEAQYNSDQAANAATLAMIHAAILNGNQSVLTALANHDSSIHARLDGIEGWLIDLIINSAAMGNDIDTLTALYAQLLAIAQAQNIDIEVIVQNEIHNNQTVTVTPAMCQAANNNGMNWD